MRLDLPKLSTTSSTSSEEQSRRLRGVLKVICTSLLIVSSMPLWSPVFMPRYFVIVLIAIVALNMFLSLVQALNYVLASVMIRKPTPQDLIVTTKDVPIHLIVVPAYKEDIDVLRTTMECFARHAVASARYIVCLAMEAREVEGAAKARTIIEEYGSLFRHVMYTSHPANMPGEFPGKGSNLAWALRECKTDLERLGFDIADILVTVGDADSIFEEAHFVFMDNHWTDACRRERKVLFGAPSVFGVSSLQVPMLVRLMDILWHVYGLVAMTMHEDFMIPTSTYSVPFTLIHDAGYHDPEVWATAEDMHTLFKLYFYTEGTMKTYFVPFPVQHLNVESVKERITQTFRHLLSFYDAAYVVVKTLEHLPALLRRSKEKLPVFMLQFYMAFVLPPLTVTFSLSLIWVRLLQPAYNDPSYSIIWASFAWSGPLMLLAQLVAVAYAYTNLHNRVAYESDKRTAKHILEWAAFPITTLFFVSSIIPTLIRMNFDLVSNHNTSSVKMTPTSQRSPAAIKLEV